MLAGSVAALEDLANGGEEPREGEESEEDEDDKTMMKKPGMKEPGMKKRPAMKTMLKIPSSKSEKAPSRVVCLSQFPSNVVDVWLQPRIRDIAGHAVLMATASINIISDDVALTYARHTPRRTMRR